MGGGVCRRSVGKSVIHSSRGEKRTRVLGDVRDYLWGTSEE